ncbi:ATP-grasp domain-containing protein [Silvanigrella aquatica]|uniref:ATP-grasp domain-containing protein n=1 Tax=Silvanigrella aquatica TaxID=1915309 RepID=A0A1L4D362_9BACT|nr:hypothetical protein [Silvanigrella aquatica]APJ04631.1 hypothetical protein AXG55_12245 [Silvanigrella aquatica]
MKHILVLTLHKIHEFQFEDWLKNFDNEIMLSLILDYESTTEDEIIELKNKSIFKFIKSYENYLNNGNVYLDVIKLHQEYPISDIISFGEDDVIRSARLRDKLGIKYGQSIENAMNFRDKILMKENLLRHNIAVHQGIPLENPLSLINFVENFQLPIFIKPRTSSGSVFGKKISDKNELIGFLEIGFTPRIPYSEYVSDLCVEIFQAGDLYHVDGICIDGEIPFICPSKYLFKGLQLNNFSQNNYSGSYMLSDDNPIFNKLVSYVEKVCKAFSLPNGYTFHAEVFVDEFQNLSLCEIACRTGGGRINETIEFAAGINLNKLQFLLQSRILSSKNALHLLAQDNLKSLCGFFLIPPQEGVCKAIPNFSEIKSIKKSKLNISLGEQGWRRSFSGDSFGYVIVEGNHEKDLMGKIEQAINFVIDNLKFEIN